MPSQLSMDRHAGGQIARLRFLKDLKRPSRMRNRWHLSVFQEGFTSTLGRLDTQSALLITRRSRDIPILVKNKPWHSDAPFSTHACQAERIHRDTWWIPTSYGLWAPICFQLNVLPGRYLATRMQKRADRQRDRLSAPLTSIGQNSKKHPKFNVNPMRIAQHPPTGNVGFPHRV